jgi:hypothetical protein
MMKHLLISVFCSLSFFCFASPNEINTHIHVDQFGYRPNASKVAVISDPVQGFNSAEEYTPGTTFEIRDWNSDAILFSAEIVAWNAGQIHSQSGDRVWWFDFSSFNEEGEYYVYDPTNNVGSYKFEISNCVYEKALKAATRAFFYQRCGHQKTAEHAIDWTDGICHHGANQDLDCRLYSNLSASTSKDLSGGWHDAGDYNKYVNFSFEPVLNLLEAYAANPSIWTDDFNITESGNGQPDILDEIKYELDWLLKMQQDNGSVLSIVGQMDYNSASPPSADNGQRVYGPATTSATFSTAAMFAKASKVFQSAGLSVYAQTLNTAAQEAWNWAVANPGVTFYNSGVIVSGEQELSTYEIFSRQLCAAVYLFELTNDATYKNFIDNNYQTAHLMEWQYAYPFEYAIQKALLVYASNSNATSSIANSISSVYLASMTNNNEDNLPAYVNGTDAYRAYMADNNYTWGSNTTKARQGLMFYDMIDESSGNNAQLFREAGEAMLQYFHGINPFNMVYLTNMSGAGAEFSVNSIYHGWFTDGSPLYDEVGISTFGPAPGFVPGGANPTYGLDSCCPSNCGSSEANGMCDYDPNMPPMGQPIQKCFRSWNTGWPQNSWTITEIGIYTQAAYVRLLSHYTGVNCSTIDVVEEITQAGIKLSVYPNPANESITVQIENGSSTATSVQLIDVCGKVIETRDIASLSSKTRLSFSIEDLAPGIYIIQTTIKGNTLAQRFIKK